MVVRRWLGKVPTSRDKPWGRFANRPYAVLPGDKNGPGDRIGPLARLRPTPPPVRSARRTHGRDLVAAYPVQRRR